MAAVSITKTENRRNFLHLRSHFPALAFVKLALLLIVNKMFQFIGTLRCCTVAKYFDLK